MSEVPFQGDPTPTKDRRAALQGKVPDKLLYQMGPSGLTHDYTNEYHATFYTLKRFIPEQNPTLQLQEDQVKRIKNLFSQTRTYREYWVDEVRQYNASAEENNVVPVDESVMLQLLVDEQPEAEML